MALAPPELSGRTDDSGKPVQVLRAAAAADWPMSGDERISMLAARMQAAMLRQGLCPGCGRSIEGLTAEADGCVVCAGCLGAWQAGGGVMPGGSPVSAQLSMGLSPPPANTTVR